MNWGQTTRDGFRIPDPLGGYDALNGVPASQNQDIWQNQSYQQGRMQTLITIFRRTQFQGAR